MSSTVLLQEESEHEKEKQNEEDLENADTIKLSDTMYSKRASKKKPSYSTSNVSTFFNQKQQSQNQYQRRASKKKVLFSPEQARSERLKKSLSIIRDDHLIN